MINRFLSLLRLSPSPRPRVTLATRAESLATRAESLATRAIDDRRDQAALGGAYPRDRHAVDRAEILADALEAWRTNPLARRIVGLTTQYVVGGGLTVTSRNERSSKFIQQFWNHRLNRMPIRCFELCDELSRSGELYLLLSTDAAGMSYIRSLPASQVQLVETSANDVEQEMRVWEVAKADGSDQVGPGGILGHPWPVYNPLDDDPLQTVALHYTVNRPVGAVHGESDLAPLLRWLSRYAAWLEDRARLNRYRQSFIYWVRAKFTSAAERLERQAELNLNPPNPGSILVSDDSETWAVLNPQLSSFEASEDGLALKKMIAAGSGNPLHFLAEPESATRTTAEASGGPTYRHYQQRQIYFLWLVQDLVRVVLRRRNFFDRLVRDDERLSIAATDISAKDNAELSQAASAIISAFLQLRQHRLIDDEELLRVAYRFAGESVDIQDLLRRGKAALDLTAPGAAPALAPVPTAKDVAK